MIPVKDRTEMAGGKRTACYTVRLTLCVTKQRTPSSYKLKAGHVRPRHAPADCGRSAHIETLRRARARRARALLLFLLAGHDILPDMISWYVQMLLNC